MYIVVPFAIFVCSKCSGLFRDFTYRVKGIFMSLFTQEEVDQLVKGGNGVAKKLWLSSWTAEDFPIPEPGDEKRIKLFIKHCFERAQWKELPTTEPLENLVGKDIVQNLRFGKKPSTSVPPKPTGNLHNHHVPKPLPEPTFEPFVGNSDHHTSTDAVWDPFGPSPSKPATHSTLPPITPAQPPSSNPVPTPGINHNPFSAFTPPPTQPSNNNNTIQPHKAAVDPHTLFVSTPTTVQVIQPINQPPYGVSPYPYTGPPPAVYPNHPYPGHILNPWVQPIAVQPQVTAVQTGPDAFSGLLPGFTKPSTPVNPIK
jgi:hypothetical protein